MKLNTKLFISAVLFLITHFTFSQNVKSVTGNITDGNGVALPGVSVIIKGTDLGTVTDFDGNYKINAEETSVLIYSYLGYKTQEVPTSGKQSININLLEDSLSLNEVIVQGYGTTSKATSNVAISQVSSENIANRPNANVLQTLQGQAAGVNIVAATGQPGAPPTVRIRGVGTISGVSEPLYIIDGIPTDANAFRSLNPNNIASVSVLKDAGATAIYGNRGSNGVILIETNKGSYNSKLKINYSGRVQFSDLFDNDYDLLNSQQQLTLERDLGAGRGATLSDEEIAAATNTDWTDVFFRTAITQSHDISMSSGGENARQFTSISYLESDGILANSDLQRFNLQSNIDGKSSNSKFKYGVNLGTNFSRSNEPNGIGGTGINRNPILAAYQSVPYISPADYVDGASLLSPLSFANTPLFIIDNGETLFRREDEIQLLASINASYEVAKGLTAKVVVSSEYRNEQLNLIEGPESFNALLFAGGKDPSGTQTIQSTTQFIYNQLASLNYNKTFDKHTIDASVFTEYFKAHYQRFGFVSEGQNPLTFAPVDDAGFVDDNSDNDFFVDDTFANTLEAGLFSYFGRVDYDYDTRFGFAGTLRRDASFRFADSNRWGTFYAVSGRWNIGNESFMEDSAFETLKLRASFGSTGNQYIQNDLAIPGIFFDGATLSRDILTAGSTYNGSNGSYQSNIGNAELEWETTKQLNIGVDFELLTKRLRGSVDWYQRDTEDLFLDRPISAAASIFERDTANNNRFATTLSSNGGEIRNTGVDLTLGFDVFRSSDPDGFNFTLNFTGNYNKQEVLDLQSDTGEIINGLTTSLREGGIVSEIYTYRYAGVNQENGNLLFLTADGDITEDPDVDNDRVFLDKNIFPDFEGGFGFNMDYKGFFVTTQFRYTIGADRFDFDLAGFQDPDNIGQFRSSTDLLNAWTPDNTNTDIPSLTATNLALGGNSDRYVTSADFLRLRFLQVGYTIPVKYLEGSGFENVRIYASGENIATFSDWRGFDPEVIDINDQTASNEFPSSRTFSLGVELGF